MGPPAVDKGTEEAKQGLEVKSLILEKLCIEHYLDCVVNLTGITSKEPVLDRCVQGRGSVF